ncbi:hypothetical protein ABZW15_20540 [Streptomyces cellulosae]
MTNGITPRSAPATVAVAGLNTAVLTAKAASVAVEWLPSSAVSTRAPAEAAIIVRYSGSAAAAISVQVLRPAGSGFSLITDSIITPRQREGQRRTNSAAAHAGSSRP